VSKERPTGDHRRPIGAGPKVDLPVWCVPGEGSARTRNLLPSARVVVTRLDGDLWRGLVIVAVACQSAMSSSGLPVRRACASAVSGCLTGLATTDVAGGHGPPSTERRRGNFALREQTRPERTPVWRPAMRLTSCGSTFGVSCGHLRATVEAPNDGAPMSTGLRDRSLGAAAQGPRTVAPPATGSASAKEREAGSSPRSTPSGNGRTLRRRMGQGKRGVGCVTRGLAPEKLRQEDP